MYYRRCDSCGAKALATATRCPRCESAFELNDEHGKRHRLVPCRTCKVVQPATATSCRWCGDDRSKRAAFPHKSLGIASSVVAAAALLIATRGTVMPILQSSFTSMSAGAAEVLGSLDGVTSSMTASRNAIQQSAQTAPATAPEKPAPSPAQVISSAVVVADSSAPASAGNANAWEEVKATTWVNVRADRRRDASIVAVLNPDEIVRLGARESGWRQVNVDGATGWVDGRHFTPSSRQ